ncbi:MAG: lytic murein transglycosylase [Thalassospira sp.]|uniref:lytic murein transglycosylase n=1 Tax=Thalassospira sp. TaxID=1912094 RepID=UPI001B13D967|nr:lytic murein transglycosylase [Thalassospira sp.]MBO6578927.1 lytic murein transglycosylase [Thalassospira sp.]MBO6820288.1 lytic murein transglycosylase [Thalassospira sp.]MBO6890247.1 lytic murein transglycosylase [Thalassospira sp.]
MKFWKLLTAASVVAVMAANAPAFAQTDEKLPEFTTEGFDEWLVEFKKEAASKGISDATLDVAFANTKPIPKVIEYDRSQPEFKLTFEQYLDRVVPQSRINEGRKKYAENREIIDAAAKKYGVPGHYLTAFWGIETGFGRFTGGYSVVDSLATLAFEGRRAEYFRKELMNALTIIDAGHIAPEKMSGSWAGAMGQAQFMPSTFLNYARDGNGDGKIDLWGAKEDVFASAANYLSSVGWHADERWGRKISLPENFNTEFEGRDIRKPISEWQQLGVRMPNGADLPAADMEASIVIVNDGEGPAYMVYNNFHTIMHWNRSTYFAIAVGTLADAIAGR